VTCPDCGHDNIDGVDTCDHCGQDLRSIDVLPRRKGKMPRQVLDTPLRDLLPLPALTVAPADPISKVIGLMQEHRHGSALVMEGERLVGVFTERDVLNRVAGRRIDIERVPVSRVMTRDPKTLRDDDTLAFAMHRMAVGSFRHIPILQEGTPPRFVSVRGVLRYLHEHAR
jgi:CBS domain-containing protein